MQKILIYTEKITPRVQYIFDFILREFSGLDFELTSNVQFFEASDLPKINYSKDQFSDEIHLKSDEFMQETGIFGSVKFEALHPVGKLFFALSRYEEYLPQERDLHGRISGKGKVYKTPFVDNWILEFQKELKSKHPQMEFKKRKFELVLTCDVDQVWKYRNKGFKRTYGAFLKDFTKLNFKELAKRREIISNREDDPFDTFDLFKSLSNGHGELVEPSFDKLRITEQNAKKIRLIFFWLMADYGKFDKNNPVRNLDFAQKIREVSQWAESGIHPSYASNSQPEKLKKEIERLEKILGQKIKKSRQHYIMLRFPETYRNLIQNGIQEDYSMAYADETGFRAGTCTPFYWYDLQAESRTDLKIHPFCAMDVTLRNYMKLSVEESIAEVQSLKSEIEKVNGEMVVLFHNSNFREHWEGWEKVMESLVE